VHLIYEMHSITYLNAPTTTPVKLARTLFTYTPERWKAELTLAADYILRRIDSDS